MGCKGCGALSRGFYSSWQGFPVIAKPLPVILKGFSDTKTPWRTIQKGCSKNKKPFTVQQIVCAKPRGRC
jgi:hypothetical protein